MEFGSKPPAPDAAAPSPAGARVPATLRDPGALSFWLAVVLTGLCAGLGAAVLTLLFEAAQELAWGAAGPAQLLEAARHASPLRHVALLLAAGLLTGFGQWLLTRLTSGNGIEITAAIWFQAGRLPALRTLGSAVLSIVIVGMGAPLGREGAPKQFGAVFGNLASDLQKLSDEQRRLMVAIGAGAGMAAVYSVPLGGALFALEVLRGALALRLVMPALAASLVAVKAASFVIPNSPLYTVPAYAISWRCLPLGGHLFAVHRLVVGCICPGDRMGRSGPPSPAGGAWSRPLPSSLLSGFCRSSFPSCSATARMSPSSCSCIRSRPWLLPPSFCSGRSRPSLPPPAARLEVCSRPRSPPARSMGSALGSLWLTVYPGGEIGLFALLGAGAMLAATTQGPISSLVLMMELTGQARAFALPMLTAIIVATATSRLIERRSIYEARLTDEQVAERLRAREPSGA